MLLIIMTPISFKANYIKPINIMKRENNTYVPYEAALVEFNPKDENDLNTIKSVSSYWKNDSFAVWIYENAYKRLFRSTNDNEHIYGIVKPQETYSKVQKNNVLGLADFSEDKNLTELNYLQIHPDNISSKNRQSIPMTIMQTIKKKLFGNFIFPETREYKNIGSAMLDFLKNKIGDRVISVYSDKNAIGFYKHNGFICPDEFYPSRLFWRRENDVTC